MGTCGTSSGNPMIILRWHRAGFVYSGDIDPSSAIRCGHLKLGFWISNRTIQKYLSSARSASSAGRESSFLGWTRLARRVTVRAYPSRVFVRPRLRGTVRTR